MTVDDWMEAPESLVVRELKAGNKIMVTTMICPKKYSKSDLKILYKKRWNIELDIRNIKDTMGMDKLSCKTPEMSIKEIWVHLLAYNIIRLLMLEAAHSALILPREISFKHSLQLWLLWSSQTDTSDNEILLAVFDLMAQQRVGNRPDRVEPRAVKRRPKTYPLLMTPRYKARENIRQNGYPKKVR